MAKNSSTNLTLHGTHITWNKPNEFWAESRAAIRATGATIDAPVRIANPETPRLMRSLWGFERLAARRGYGVSRIRSVRNTVTRIAPAMIPNEGKAAETMLVAARPYALS